MTATLNKDEQTVAAGIAKVHLETSHLQYNDENALSYTVSLAYYSARQQYDIIREFPAGNGFADMVFLPKKHYARNPAIIVELKWNHDAETAISQIHEKGYGEALGDYNGRVLLVGIAYDRKTREHVCRIEEMKNN